MGTSGAKALQSLGFLTVIEDDQHGLFGGYLLLNTAGRPLEFHCTAPIKPNRAQQILYGPTLEPYLYGEQIAQTLVSKAKVEPLVLFTDRAPVAAVREYIRVPVGLVLEIDGTGKEDGEQDAAHSREQKEQADARSPLWIGRNRVSVSATHADDRSIIEQRLRPSADLFDLAEPFQRIREAIEEARAGGSKAA